MSSSCCGTKKQKLNNSTSVLCNGSSAGHKDYKNIGKIAKPEMCFFCFDVLYSHLHCLDPPKTPDFNNDP